MFSHFLSLPTDILLSLDLEGLRCHNPTIVWKLFSMVLYFQRRIYDAKFSFQFFFEKNHCRKKGSKKGGKTDRQSRKLKFFPPPGQFYRCKPPKTLLEMFDDSLNIIQSQPKLNFLHWKSFLLLSPASTTENGWKVSLRKPLPCLKYSKIFSQRGFFGITKVASVIKERSCRGLG